ncbi:MAG: hypothetical protein ACOYM7_10365 [Paludibacter sp.]
MKKIFYIFALVAFALTSCDKNEFTNENESNLKTENDYLMDIYNKSNNVFRQIQNEPNNITIIKELDSVIYLSKSHFVKQGQNSIHGKFYSKAEDVYSQSNLDYYSENSVEFINFTQNNCSKEYANYITKYLTENEICFTIENIILNDSLPENEKISLILLLTYSENQLVNEEKSGMRKVNEAACGKAYNTAISRCNRNTIVGLAFSGLAGIGSGGLALTIGVSYVWATDMMCRGDASDDYFDCVN